MNQPEPGAPEGESAHSKSEAEAQWSEFSFQRLLERFFQAKNFPAIDEDFQDSLNRRAKREE